MSDLEKSKDYQKGYRVGRDRQNQDSRIVLVSELKLKECKKLLKRSMFELMEMQKHLDNASGSDSRSSMMAMEIEEFLDE